ncbi:hypothetical protein Rsub_07025 [Raphidocelis subcapitata]|uniref:N-acetyltransferase domain-containing protein n=1 Tax=Raphidocelis subcapitata TaxID=307507 RepID=A0A2V0P3P2_9CHLO|nr:hypothetical protein Rsub_07025 [Raphidocelis subcapitata]|eukprot:GBF94491.1 hypothetical protein Rsub_07025 [Raphidocelis subcapitata]
MRAQQAVGARPGPRAAPARRRATDAAALGVAQPSARRGPRPRRLFDNSPHITYTVGKRDVTPEELQRLFRLCAADAAAASGSRARRSHWRHWTQEPEETVEKLRTALHGSVAIAAAFTRDPRLLADDSDDEDGAPSPPSSLGSSLGDDEDYGASSSGGSFSSGGSGAWRSPLLQWGSALLGGRRQPRLVGFARAAGDYSLVATVLEVAVHPDLRGMGIGAKLLKRIVNQVCASDVGDIGLVAPSELRPFFQGCSFDLDREASVPMVLRGLEGGGAAEVARVAANERLRELLRDAELP